MTIDMSWQTFLVILVLLVVDGVAMFACGWHFHKSELQEQSEWAHIRKLSDATTIAAPTDLAVGTDDLRTGFSTSGVTIIPNWTPPAEQLMNAEPGEEGDDHIYMPPTEQVAEVATSTPWNPVGNIRRCPECHEALTLEIDHDVYRPQHADGEYMVYNWTCRHGHESATSQELERVYAK